MDTSEDNGCCNDVYKLVKVEQDQSTPESQLQLNHYQPPVTPLMFDENIAYYFPSGKVKIPFSDALLRSCGIEVFIRNCVFLI